MKVGTFILGLRLKADRRWGSFVRIPLLAHDAVEVAQENAAREQ